MPSQHYRDYADSDTRLRDRADLVTSMRSVIVGGLASAEEFIPGAVCVGAVGPLR